MIQANSTEGLSPEEIKRKKRRDREKLLYHKNKAAGKVRVRVFTEAQKEKRREAVRRWTKKTWAADPAFRARRSAANKAWKQKNHAYVLKKNAEWAAKNPEKQKAAIARWMINNKAHLAAVRRKYDQDRPEATRARHAKFAQNNPDKVLAYRRKSYWKHVDKRRAASARYKIENPEKIRAKKLAWAATEAGRISAVNSSHKRRVIERSAEKPPSTDELIALKKKANGRCHYCTKRHKRLAVEHVMPLSRGGLHTLSNIVMACKSCNSSKGTKTPEEWAAQLGLLLI